MSGEHDPIGEDDLHAYVDDRLAPARRDAVARHLAANPALRQRVTDWQEQAAALRRAILADDASRQAAMLGRLRDRAAAPRRSVMAAGIVLALAAGGAVGWVAHGDRGPPEIARLGIEAATAYRIFANDPARAIEISSDNRAELVGWLTQKLGRRVTPPDLSAMGYHLMGGRVLSAMYGPAALLLYRDAADNRITVYLQPMKIGEPAPMRPTQAQAVDGYAWIERQIGYSVMSEGDRTLLHSVADQVRAATES